MPHDLYRRILGLTLSLYFIATWSSMAAMEIFGWLTFVLAFSYILRKPEGESLTLKSFDTFLPWKSTLLLLLITGIGVFVNGNSETDIVFSWGSQRWMFLLFALSIALTVSPPTIKGYRVFLIFTSVVAVYGVFQSITGIDFLRSGNRAVLPLGLEAKVPLWRTAGLFGHPMQYAYIAGMHVCLPLAVGLLTYKRRNQLGWIFWGSVAAYVLITMSLVTSFTRGAWIAMAISHLAVAWFVSPKFAAALTGAGATVVAILFSTVEMFRTRILTLFDTSYHSNSDRLFLWKINWEMFKDYPIFGIGYQENERRAGEYAELLGRPDAFTGHAHNNYLQMLSGTGITGFFAYMFIISFMFWLTLRLWKSLPQEYLWARALALACLGAQLHLHIGGFTECNFKTGVTNHNFMVVWALVVSMTVLLNLNRTKSFKVG